VTISSSPDHTCWAQVFTAETWSTFVERGATVTGFRDTRWNLIRQMKPGDVILCYINRISTFIGILRVTGHPYLDVEPIWQDELFPCRVQVEAIRILPLDQGIPIRKLRNLSVFRSKNWSIHLVASPSKWKQDDARIVMNAIEAV
jgi:hypothetical protein